MTTLDTRLSTSPVVSTLHRLYLARFGFALVWALVVVLAASTPGPLSTALLVLYPLVDLAAAVVDQLQTTSPEQTAALLRAVLGAQAATVGKLLAQ